MRLLMERDISMGEKKIFRITPFSFAVLKDLQGRVYVEICDGQSEPAARKMIKDIGENPAPELIALIRCPNAESIHGDDPKNNDAYALLCLLVHQSFDSGEGLVSILNELVLDAFTQGYEAGKAAASA